jgi:hypothetical protein
MAGNAEAASPESVIIPGKGPVGLCGEVASPLPAVNGLLCFEGTLQLGYPLSTSPFVD